VSARGLSTPLRGPSRGVACAHGLRLAHAAATSCACSCPPPPPAPTHAHALINHHAATRERLVFGISTVLCECPWRPVCKVHLFACV
jgi:hypothetical protein